MNPVCSQPSKCPIFIMPDPRLGLIVSTQRPRERDRVIPTLQMRKLKSERLSSSLKVIELVSDTSDSQASWNFWVVCNIYPFAGMKERQGGLGKNRQGTCHCVL